MNEKKSVSELIGSLAIENVADLIRQLLVISFWCVKGIDIR